MSNVVKWFVGFMTAFIALLAVPAHAAIDVAPLVADITANKSGMETIALAILGILAFIFGIKLLRRVLS